MPTYNAIACFGSTVRPPNLSLPWVSGIPTYTMRH